MNLMSNFNLNFAMIEKSLDVPQGAQLVSY